MLESPRKFTKQTNNKTIAAGLPPRAVASVCRCVVWKCEHHPGAVRLGATGQTHQGCAFAKTRFYTAACLLLSVCPS